MLTSVASLFGGAGSRISPRNPTPAEEVAVVELDGYGWGLATARFTKPLGARFRRGSFNWVYARSQIRSLEIVSPFVYAPVCGQARCHVAQEEGGENPFARVARCFGPGANRHDWNVRQRPGTNRLLGVQPGRGMGRQNAGLLGVDNAHRVMSGNRPSASLFASMAVLP
jgi:hypothetical protein